MIVGTRPAVRRSVSGNRPHRCRFRAIHFVWTYLHPVFAKRTMMHIRQKPPVILVVDDEQQVLDEVETVLLAAGYDCRCCATAEEAIALVRSVAPALIISDINLHGHSGLEMCEQIKKDPSMADVPVMFLSGAQIPDVIRRSHDVGGTYYLRKPFDPEVLVELIDKALWMPHLVSNRASANAPQPAHR